MAEKKKVQRLMYAEDVAKRVGVKTGTITEYCRRIEKGEISLQQRVREECGIISIDRDGGKWMLLVEVEKE